MTTPPRDELGSPERMPSTRGRVAVAAFVVLALAVVAIAASRPDRQGAGTPIAGASPSASPSPSPESSPSPSPIPSPRPAPSPLPVPPPLTLKTGVRLVVEQSTQLDVLDVDTGRLTRLARDPDFVHYDRLDVLATGGQLVMVGDNNTGAGSGPFPVYGTTAGPRSKLRPLGQEASSLMPSAHRGRVWLVADNETSDPAWGETLLEVDVRGVVRRRATFVHWFGVQPFGSGFLRTTHLADGSDGPDTELVDERGRRQRLFPGQGVLAVYGTTAVLGETMPCDKGPCRLRVLTAGVPLGERAVALAEKPQTSRFRVNPAGTRLLARNPRGGLGPADVLSEIDLRTGESRPVEGASADGNFFGPQFSADGRWMLFVDGDRAHIDAFDLRERHAYRVKGTFSRFTQITVLD